MRVKIPAKSSYTTSNNYAKVLKSKSKTDLTERSSVTLIKYSIKKGNFVI